MVDHLQVVADWIEFAGTEIYKKSKLGEPSRSRLERAREMWDGEWDFSLGGDGSSGNVNWI